MFFITSKPEGTVFVDCEVKKLLDDGVTVLNVNTKMPSW